MGPWTVLLLNPLFVFWLIYSNTDFVCTTSLYLWTEYAYMFSPKKGIQCCGYSRFCRVIHSRHESQSHYCFSDGHKVPKNTFPSKLPAWSEHFFLTIVVPTTLISTVLLWMCFSSNLCLWCPVPRQLALVSHHWMQCLESTGGQVISS